MFKIKDGYNLELQIPETIKLFGSPRNFLGTTNEENVLESKISWISFSPM